MRPLWWLQVPWLDLGGKQAGLSRCRISELLDLVSNIPSGERTRTLDVNQMVHKQKSAGVEHMPSVFQVLLGEVGTYRFL